MQKYCADVRDSILVAFHRLQWEAAADDDKASTSTPPTLLQFGDSKSFRLYLGKFRLYLGTI
jgi:hypothetical protein